MKRAIKQIKITNRDADKLCDGCLFKYNRHGYHGTTAECKIPGALDNIFPCEEPIKDGNQIVMNDNYIWVRDTDE